MGRVGQDVTRSQCDGADLARARVRESERQRRTQASLPVYNPQALEAHRAEQVVRSRQEEKASHMIVNGLQRFLRTTAVMLRKGQDRDANTMESERWEGRALKTTSHPRMARMARIMKECHQRRQPWTTGETTRRTAKILVQALTTVLKRGRLLWMTARLRAATISVPIRLDGFETTYATWQQFGVAFQQLQRDTFKLFTKRTSISDAVRNKAIE
ncbi:hypothetical protein PI124_g18647 [Phytophthora idaei]|nr:hypothetical protein PI124_g18647 [Phytophthora idaei]